MLRLSKRDIDELKSTLERDFGLVVRSMKRLQGFYDGNFKLATSKGPYFIKVYGYDTLPAIQFQTSLIEVLRHAGLPVGELVHTRDKKTYFKFKKTYGIMQEFITGRHLDDGRVDEKLISSVGQMLGKFDRATEKATFKGKKWKKYGWDLAQFNIPASRLPSLKKLLPKKVFELSSGAVAEWRKQRLQLSKLRKGVIHNDFHGSNVLVKDNTCSGVVDFGDAMYSWVAVDLAVALAHLCFARPNRVLTYSRALLKTYLKAFPLNNAEKHYLPLLIQMRACLITVELVHLRKTPSMFEKKFFRDAVFTLKYFSDPKNMEIYSKLIREGGKT